jgi:hypothetical protein
MKKTTLALALGTLALGTLALVGLATAGQAAERRAGSRVAVEAAYQPTNGRYTRKRPVMARAYRARRIGFYSYTYRDVINTYGMSRARYGSINSYRDPFVDRQTANGPFDHGFFFDSGMAPRGGDSPYLH